MIRNRFEEITLSIDAFFKTIKIKVRKQRLNEDPQLVCNRTARRGNSEIMVVKF